MSAVTAAPQTVNQIQSLVLESNSPYLEVKNSKEEADPIKIQKSRCLFYALMFHAALFNRFKDERSLFCMCGHNEDNKMGSRQEGQCLRFY